MEHFGRYLLDERIGSGGFGEVFRATDPILRRNVAIKLLKPDTDSAFSNRYLNEARAASALNHPNIVTIHDRDLDWQRETVRNSGLDVSRIA